MQDKKNDEKYKINTEIIKLKNEKYQTKNYIFLHTQVELLYRLLNEELLSYIKISKLLKRVFSIQKIILFAR